MVFKLRILGFMRKNKKINKIINKNKNLNTNKIPVLLSTKFGLFFNIIVKMFWNSNI